MWDIWVIRFGMLSSFVQFSMSIVISPPDIANFSGVQFSESGEKQQKCKDKSQKYVSSRKIGKQTSESKSLIRAM